MKRKIRGVLVGFLVAALALCGCGTEKSVR